MLDSANHKYRIKSNQLYTIGEIFNDYRLSKNMRNDEIWKKQSKLLDLLMQITENALTDVKCLRKRTALWNEYETWLTVPLRM